MARPWLMHQTDASPPQYLQQIGLFQWALLESMVALILLGFGSLMLVAEHINGELRRLAEKDGLTDIFNRRAFLTLFNKAASLAQRSQSDLPLLLVDLDHFKHINDTWGHGRGDEALRHFVQVARGCLRNEDLIGRMGGEEFAIYLPNARLADAHQVAERLREAVAISPLLSPQGRVDLTVSIGVTLGAAGESVEAILHRADRAMYLAKHRGRNRVEIEAEPQPA
jgi:diguanylate cyclase (GGDEF)-like protein